MNTGSQPAVRVLGFKQTFELRPLRGDRETEKVDAKGFLVDDKGNRRMRRETVDWVSFAPPSAMGPHSTTERVEHLIPDPEKLGRDPTNRKLIFMVQRWDAIKPAYEAWKLGQEVPLSGTALGAWPGLSPEQAEAFRRLGIRSVEEVRDLLDGQIDRIPLPNVREIRRQAKTFIDNLGAAAAADREQQKEQVISNLQQQIAEMRDELSKKHMASAAPAVVDDEVTELRTQLDAKGIQYDKRWAAPKLRSALMAEAA